MTNTKSSDTILHLQDICYSYPSGKMVLDHLNLKFNQGDRIGLVAPNGSGKTTLFLLIMGLLTPDSGKIRFFNSKVDTEKDFKEIRKKIGLLFQDSDDQLFCPTVIEDVAFGPLNLGKSKQDALDISRKTLDFLGLKDFDERITFQLSGGEKRLVSLATVLSMEPKVLLLDEPTTGLDKKTKLKIKKVLNDLDLSYIIISHEFDFLSETCDHIFTMEDGKLITDEHVHFHFHKHAHKQGKQPHKHA